MDFPGDPDSKKSACNVGDLGSIPGLERSPGEGNSYPLQYSGLENSMERGARQAIVHKESTRLSDLHSTAYTHTHTHTHTCIYIFIWQYLPSIRSVLQEIHIADAECSFKVQALQPESSL